MHGLRVALDLPQALAIDGQALAGQGEGRGRL